MYDLLINVYHIIQAKGLLSEYQPKYNSARAVYRERKKYVDEIDWNLVAVPPSGSIKASSCLFSLLFIKFLSIAITFIASAVYMGNDYGFSWVIRGS